MRRGGRAAKGSEPQRKSCVQNSGGMAAHGKGYAANGKAFIGKEDYLRRMRK